MYSFTQYGMKFDVIDTGCMESIVQYKRLLLKSHRANVDVPNLLKDCRDLLLKLQALDPLRRNRYQTLGRELLLFHIELFITRPLLEHDLIGLGQT